MDKKNTLLGIICIGAGIGFMFWQSKQLQEQREQQLLNEPVAVEQAESTTPVDAALDAGDAAAVSTADSGDAMLGLLSKDATETKEAAAEVLAPLPEEKTITLSNEYIEVTFTTRGGAIRTVDFLQTKRGGRDDYVFNQDGYLPALSLSLAGKDGGIREFALDYKIEEQTDNSVTFAFDSGDGLVIRRSYTLASDDGEHDPYTIRHSTTFNNESATPKALSTIYFNLGTARPISAKQLPSYLNVGHFNGEDAEFVALDKLTGGKKSLFGKAREPKTEIEQQDRIEWSSVKNQFFAAVLSSETVGRDLYIYPVDAVEDGNGAVVSGSRKGITGSVGYPVGMVPAGEGETLDFDFFVGPKEFKRLQAMGNQQDRVMQFGFLSFVSKTLLTFMYGIHKLVPSWGWSIVIMTICIKSLFWPLTAKASRSQKRMSKIQGPMAELKEKYKDNPQRLQQETLKLFKENQVNPVAGCLPMFIQMPIFLGLFYMLRTASELRHEPFLWVADLSQPDTLFYIHGFPINLLPMLMGVTMFLQMRMMPVSPTADPAQQKIFKFLPFVFLIFLYNYASGLVVYWTMQNILTIVQQKIINSRPDVELKPAAVAAAPTGKGGTPSTKPRKRK